MSYNYLPLDRKWLSFQQIKNLLDYDQLVSITFDAHERILKCREYLDDLQQKETNQTNLQQIEEEQLNLLKNAAGGIGKAVPAAIVKLMLMLKIKSLSFGNSGVQIETVKRLMEMYNNGVLPVVYMRGSAGVDGDAAMLSHLSLPLIGLGEVNFNGEKKPSDEVFTQLKWQPVNLQSNEAAALLSGTQFTSAYGIFALKNSEHLLKMADVIAALSIAAFDCNTGFLLKNVHLNNSNKGQVNTVETISKYLKEANVENKKSPEADPYSFRCILQVHGAAKDAFAYVLNVFLNQINSVSESTSIFPDEKLILNSGNFHGQPLALALDFICLSLVAVADMSYARTDQLLSQNNAEKFGNLQATAASIVDEIKHLATLSSINSGRLNDTQDFVSMSANAAIRTLRLIKHLEEILAIELLSASKVFEYKRPIQEAGTLLQFQKEFKQSASLSNAKAGFRNDVEKAVEFMNGYKI